MSPATAQRVPLLLQPARPVLPFWTKRLGMKLLGVKRLAAKLLGKKPFAEQAFAAKVFAPKLVADRPRAHSHCSIQLRAAQRHRPRPRSRAPHRSPQSADRDFSIARGAPFERARKLRAASPAWNFAGRRRPLQVAGNIQPFCVQSIPRPLGQLGPCADPIAPIARSTVQRKKSAPLH